MTTTPPTLGGILDRIATDGMLPTDAYVEAHYRGEWICTARGYDVEWLRACAHNDALLCNVDDVRVIIDADLVSTDVYRWDPRDAISEWQEPEPFRYIGPDAEPGYRVVGVDEHRRPTPAITPRPALAPPRVRKTQAGN